MVPAPLHPGPVTTVLEQCHISPSPAPEADQPRSLPLTFFDVVFWDFPPVQRLFFYGNSDRLGAPDFQAKELPRFKASLAAALHHFYPLAGKLKLTGCGLAEGSLAPEVAFADGDAVRFTVAVSGEDFDDLAGDDARDVARLRPLLPLLERHAVLAVQVTVFPGAGICVGTTLHHAVADGSSYVHFMKTWAAVHREQSTRKAAAAAVVPMLPLPLFDRGVVRDDAGLREAFIADYRDLAAAGDTRLADWDLSRRPGVVLATFRFTEKQLRRLGRHVESETSARCSPYALACGAAWAGIVHARGGSSDDACFGFVTGCKPRASPPVPANYFGNCLGLCRVEAPPPRPRGVGRSVLTAADAAVAIWRVIEGLKEEGRALRDARGWVRCVRDYASRRAVTVAGSPKLGVYDVDFGGAWGRPRKVEIASVERTGALALAESGHDCGEGGIEVGVAMPRDELDAFRTFYRDLFASID